MPQSSSPANTDTSEPKGASGEANVESIGGKDGLAKLAIDKLKDSKKSDDESKGTEGETRNEPTLKSKFDRKLETSGDIRRERERDRDSRDRDRDRDRERDRRRSRDRDRGRDSDKEREREEGERDKLKDHGHRSRERAKDSGTSKIASIFHYFLLCILVIVKSFYWMQDIQRSLNAIHHAV